MSFRDGGGIGRNEVGRRTSGMLGRKGYGVMGIRGRSCLERNPLLREWVRVWVFLLTDHFMIWRDSMYKIFHFLLDSYP